MWYEIIPSAAIITTALAVPAVFNYYFHSFMQNGNPYRRRLATVFDKDMYLRDLRLNGNPYVSQGLDHIPDEN